MTTIAPPRIPKLCGREAELQNALQAEHTVFLNRSNIDLSQVRSGFACALHMHQPTIPAGKNGELISNLQHMFEHSGEGDNHNAGVFAWCYERMGDFIPELVDRGLNPRIMLDYSGNLLWGLQQMGRDDILNKLKVLACNPRYQPHVEWLGTMWSHAVATSTPIPDLKLQIRAWQHHFADIFGLEALGRVKGFSPPEMHLPNHPDTLYEYLKALKDCGYRWLLVQEHSVENLNGSPLTQTQKYGPTRLTARNSNGETVSLTALIKTQGSDTKLVAQMQPFHEAKNLGRITIGTHSIPSLVSQIADGENGGVMMNEFPRDFGPTWDKVAEITDVTGFNGTEYLELIEAAGVKSEDYPEIQAVQQHRIWQRVKDVVTPESVATAIRDIKAEDSQFSMEGASWTNDLSWVQGYENVLEPMNELSAKFHARFPNGDPGSSNYSEALLYVMLLETSCFRYWGQGIWTDYARSLYDRGMAAIG